MALPSEFIKKYMFGVQQKVFKPMKITWFKPFSGTGIAQSVQFLNTDWITGVQYPAEAKNASSSLSDQTRSEAHPASYPMGTEGPFSGVKCRWGMMLTIHPHLVPRSRMSRSYTSSPP
jgi:hypothetical protein